MRKKKYKGIGVFITTGNGFKAPLDAIFQNLDSEKYDLYAIDFFKDLGLKRWDGFWKAMWGWILKHPGLLKFNYIIQKKFLFHLYIIIHYCTVKKEIFKWLEDEKPDFILSTHFVTTLLLPYFVMKSGNRIPVFAYNAEVISAHAVNVSMNIDSYFSPADEGAARLIKCGQPASSIIKTPFPINKNFTETRMTCREARKKIGYSDMFTILISFGGDGIGSTSFVEMIAAKKMPVQIIAVCGRSRVLYNKLEIIKQENPDAIIHLHGFVDNIPDLMRCSDICAGKAGMNAVFESIFLRKPFIATNALFNELETIHYLVENGFGWDALKLGEQLRIVESCIENPEYYDTILQNISNAAVDFEADKYDRIIAIEIEKYKKTVLKNSKALYFDMAGTLCDIPITAENWDQINIDGIRKVMNYLGLNNLVEEKELQKLTGYFIENKRTFRKQAKTSLEESAISDQLRNFMIYAESNYSVIKKNRGLQTINHEDMRMMEKLFVSPELGITIPFEGIVELLEKLEKKYDLYLLSNNVSRQLVSDIIDKIGCTHCFKDVFVSEDCGYRKPHITFLNYVTSKTKLKPNECVMIGDRLTQDIRLANLHDLKSIYAAIVNHEDNEGADGEYYDYIIHNLKELEEVFL